MLAAVAALSSCDPQVDSKDWSGQTVKAEELSVITEQYNLNADGTYEPCADGNWIKFFTNPSKVVEVYYINDKGVQMTLSKGTASGMINLKPSRGSNPTQTLHFRTYEYDRSSVEVTKDVTVQVATDLSTEMKLLCSNSGAKKWYWAPTSANGGAVWGNGGYQAGAQDASGNINGAWWGCGVEDGECKDKFSGQLQHSVEGKITGEEYAFSYMQFNEDGTIDKYTADGDKLNTGKFEIKDYNNGEPIDANLNVAYLETSEGAILWPYSINHTAPGDDGLQAAPKPTRFEVAYLSVDRMILIYAPAGRAGWKECTWWSFGSNDDLAGYMTTSKDWTWSTTTANGGAVWGNGGYQAGAQDASGNINGAWWGCGVEDGECKDKFSSQLQHSVKGAITGEEYSTSYMTFTEDGQIVKFDKDGKKLNEGTWEIVKGATPGGYNAWLKTSAGAILWPYSINHTAPGDDGLQATPEPTAFEIGYISSNNLILIYAPEGRAGWKECTWWSFKKK